MLIVGLAAVTFAAGCGGSSNGWNSNETNQVIAKLKAEGATQSEAACVVGVMKAHSSPMEIIKAVQEGASASLEAKLGAEAFSKCDLSHSLANSSSNSTSTGTEPPSTEQNPTETPPNPSNEVKPPCSKEHPCEPGENGE